jgi:hypothetical protein
VLGFGDEIARSAMALGSRDRGADFHGPDDQEEDPEDRAEHPLQRPQPGIGADSGSPPVRTASLGLLELARGIILRLPKLAG